MLPLGLTQFDIFSGSTRLARDLEDSIVKVSAGTIRFGSAYPLCAVFSSDGRSIVTGSGDGILEVFDADTCRIRNDLAYQREDEFMLHDSAVLAAVISSDGELLASGSRDGQIKIWRLSTGDCVRVRGHLYDVIMFI
jgi:WD40 repeat-containing protein SMU1